MPKTRETLVYSYSELSRSAQENARDGWRKHGLGYEWWDAVFDNATEVGKCLGIEIENIYFSGFSSQGDGACFTGNYAHCAISKEELGNHLAPNDTEILGEKGLAAQLTELQSRYDNSISATIRHTGRYSHEMSTTISVECSDEEDEEGNLLFPNAPEDELSQILRDFMRWIYKRLESEYDWLLSDEMIAEEFETGGIEFDEEGNVA